NTLTHGVGCLLSIAGVAWLASLARAHGDFYQQIGVAIYGASLVAVYAAAAAVSDRRPGLYLSADRRDVHPPFAHLLAHGLLVDFIRSGLDDRPVRLLLEGDLRASRRIGFDRAPRRAGLAAGQLPQTNDRARAWRSVRLDVGRRHLLHRGHDFLAERRAGSLFPRRLASAGDRRQRAAFLGHRG